MLLLAVYRARPQSAGYLAGSIWLATVLLPSLLQRVVVSSSLQQRHRRARILANLVRLLHPFDGFWEQAELYRALEAAQRGDVELAARIFDRLRGARSALSHVAAMHYFRITEQWQSFADWTLQMAKEGELARNPTLLVHYLRALGEIGGVEELVRTHQRFRGMERTLPPSVRLTVLAFAGRRQATEALLASVLVDVPEGVKSCWRATADFAAGDPDTAQRRLRPLLDDGDGTIRSLAKGRLEHPPPPAAELLSPEAQAWLVDLEKEIELEERYRPAYGGLMRRARVTWVLIALSVLAFAVEEAAGGSMDPATLFGLGAVDVESVLAGQVWRLLAATFLHYGFLHLALNMIGLSLFGPFVERALGVPRFVLVYLAAGIGGMSAVLLEAVLLDRPILLVGASGGIMGLLGATAFLLLRGWRHERARPAKTQLRQIGIILALQTLFDLSIEEVSFVAHFFGMVFGFLTCAVVARTTKK